MKNYFKFLVLITFLASNFTIFAQKSILTPEILWSMGRIGEMQLSPDESKILYSVTFYNVEANKGSREIYIYDLKIEKTTQITNNQFNEYSPVWRPDGKKIAYLSPKDGIMQIWEMNPDGTEIKAVTNETTSISNFSYSPKVDKILFTIDVKVKATSVDIYPDLPKANVLIINDLMYRHWDTWEDEFFSHIFITDYDIKSSTVSKSYDIMTNEAYDAPTKPFGGIEEISWSPDGQKIAYTCKKLEGKNYAISTNTDIYLYNLTSKKTENISLGNMGYDKNPVFSNSGKQLAWESMERDGFEADKIRIFIYDFEKKTTINYSEKLDYNFTNYAWSKDDSKLYFIGGINATHQIYELEFKTMILKKITDGWHDYTGFNLAEKFIVGTKMSMSSPVEIFKIDIKKEEEKQITFINKKILDNLKLGKVEERWIATTDGKKMLTWVIYPPDFDPNKKYPTLLYCQGGPQSAVSQFFSFRWNFQIMAANGYIIVAPNRRGLPSFGQEWNDQISKDYGGQNMQDYLSAIDELAKEPYVDKDKLGAVGASYGGLSVFWLAGNHDKRFKVFIAHDGIFNFVSMYGATEETFFVDWDLGGPYWKPETKNCWNSSPHLFVDKWDTPILIIQGGMDFRVVETQAFEAFTAARLKGLDSKLLYFPEENHWILKPQNGILWQREFFAWLDKYLK